MTAGERFIKNNFIEELSYDEAIKASIEELKRKGVTSPDDFYEEEMQSVLYDNPIYPLNAELYDEFVCDGYLDVMEYTAYIFKRFAMAKKAITANQAYKLIAKLGLDFGDDGRTFYATNEEESEVWEFDSKAERDEFVNRY